MSMTPEQRTTMSSNVGTTPTVFEKSRPGRRAFRLPRWEGAERRPEDLLPAHLVRQGRIGLPEIGEPALMRHFIELSTKNHHIDKAMYPLGSCTMKYNPKVNEEAARLDSFRGMHPLQDDADAQGALEVLWQLRAALEEICGMEEFTLLPAAGAHGEWLAMKMIRRHFVASGHPERDVVIIPDSAHGTNPASVRMAGMRTVQLQSGPDGLLDVERLEALLDDRVAAIMITNPTTVGLFEERIVEVNRLMHAAGAFVYMDGANMNALVGVARPGDMGFDVMHLNLHKTFSTPHGGGGPGAGPIGVRGVLRRYLPGPRLERAPDGTLRWGAAPPGAVGPVHSYWGNFGILLRALTYVKMHGRDGLRRVAENAVLNANYLRVRLRGAYEVKYDRPCMHEVVLRGTAFRKHGVKTLDVAKRLMDYGLHPPTIYFPLIVEDALMIEPTETENRESLDHFVDAMLAIRQEMVENPEVILQAPHVTPVGRLDEGLAARQLDLTWKGDTAPREHEAHTS
jgi:glycine dehydrogenase subunit 2